MKIFRKSTPSITYRIFLYVMILFALAIIVIYIIKGEFNTRSLFTYGALVALLLSYRRSAYSYVAIDKEFLYIASNSKPELSNQVYNLSEISSIEFGRKKWFEGGNYTISIKKNLLHTEIKEIGAMGSSEILELTKELEMRGIHVIS